jgi:hypothetical protein
MSEAPHDVLIALHALAGVVCFVAGALSLRVWTARSWRFQVLVVSLAALWLFLLGAVAVDWSGISAGTRWLYAGLPGLGLYMLWRGARRGHQRPRRTPDLCIRAYGVGLTERPETGPCAGTDKLTFRLRRLSGRFSCHLRATAQGEVGQC